MEYWQPEEKFPFDRHGYRTELRGTLFLDYVARWGMICGERSVDGAVVAVMPVPEVVARASAMADAAVTEMERRGWIRSTATAPAAPKT